MDSKAKYLLKVIFLFTVFLAVLNILNIKGFTLMTTLMPIITLLICMFIVTSYDKKKENIKESLLEIIKEAEDDKKTIH